MSKRLEQLLKKKEELTAQIQKIKARETQEKRKEDTRRKILLGALMMEMMERGELEREVIWKRLSGFLSRESDRKLFGLAVDGDGGEPSVKSEEIGDLQAFEVVLLEVPPEHKLAILKVVRVIADLGLKEAKDLVESAPKVVLQVNGQEEAEGIKKELEEVGAKVSMREFQVPGFGG